VDNNSSDGSVPSVREMFPEVRLILLNKNMGFGTANNAGVKDANGKYVFLLNSDTIVTKDILTPLISFYEKHPDQKIGALGTLLISRENEILHSFGNFPNLLLSRTKEPDKRTIQQYILAHYYSKVEVVVGADLFLARDTYLQFTGFDEKIFLYEEELEFQYRMQLEGYASIIINEQGIIHLEGKSSPDFIKKKYFFISLAYILKKHKSSKAYYLYRLDCVRHALISLKSRKTTWTEKLKYLKLTIFYKADKKTEK
jgi:GT2 family glycosyltransferase